jgi:hypothetical protein
MIARIVCFLFLCVSFLNAPPARAEDIQFGHGAFCVLSGASCKIRFKVEVAESEAQHERGLMYRQSLAEDAGMIFLFQPPQEANFWMKNTLIPLDMLFIRADGSIAKIIANAKPQDLSILASGEPVRAVVEIKGGTALLQGIKVGDKTSFHRAE